jgi:chromosomal replication initiator protein
MMNPASTFDTPHDVWIRVCAELQKLISPDAFKRWFTPLTAVSVEGETLTLSAENSIYQHWIEENYLPQVRQAAGLVLGRDIQVAFVCAQGAGTASRADSEEEEAPAPTRSTPGRTMASELKPTYTFDSFVVGINNQFAHAAARAVAESPARTYNPLFIHGATGLGKTHLLHAIGNFILSRKKNAKIIYVTSEQFTNEFINAIQNSDLARFRKRFRQADALFIDDIQFLGGKDRSQEEFFHTFNTLFDGNRQIVLTSDVAPTELPNLERRLVSRFEWGLTAELQAPDIETRLAILRKKTSQMQVRLGDSILLFIAERIKANVRRLEGALTRVAAWAALHDRQISPALVEDLLKDFIQQEARQPVTIESIQRKVAENFDIRVSDMSSARRPANIALPRMVAMYLSRRLTSKTLQEIGSSFGGRDHGTVIHAVKTIEEKMLKDPQLQQTVQFLCQKLESGAA